MCKRARERINRNACAHSWCRSSCCLCEFAAGSVCCNTRTLSFTHTLSRTDTDELGQDASGESHLSGTVYSPPPSFPSPIGDGKEGPIGVGKEGGRGREKEGGREVIFPAP